MLDKIPLALIRGAAADEAALRELATLLRPASRSVLSPMSKTTRDPEQLQRRFERIVLAALRSHYLEPHLQDEKREFLTGFALTSLLMDVRNLAIESELSLRAKETDAGGTAGEKAGKSVARSDDDAVNDSVDDPVLGGDEPDEGDAGDASPLSVYVDLATTSPDEVLDLLLALSDLYRSVGGDGLVVRSVGTMQPALIPVDA
jgi:hypothetical protein